MPISSVNRERARARNGVSARGAGLNADRGRGWRGIFSDGGADKSLEYLLNVFSRFF